MLDNNNNVSVLPEGHVTMPINFCCNDYERKRKKYSIVKKKHFLNLYFFNKKNFKISTLLFPFNEFWELRSMHNIDYVE